MCSSKAEIEIRAFGLRWINMYTGFLNDDIIIQLLIAKFGSGQGEH
jgi:hypothetical protein